MTRAGIAGLALLLAVAIAATAYLVAAVHAAGEPCRGGASSIVLEDGKVSEPATFGCLP